MGFNYPHQELILKGPMNGHLEKPYLEDIAAAQSNTLYLHADLSDPNQANPERPEAFVEFGSHEFWPTDKWSVFAATKHSGDDLQHTFIPQTIPNLGEIEHPMGDLQVGRRLQGLLGGNVRKQCKPIVTWTIAAYHLELVRTLSANPDFL